MCSLSPGTAASRCRLKLVNFEALENQTSHETEGLGNKHLVVRRGKPFNVTLLFHNRSINPHTESLVLEVCLGIKDVIVREPQLLLQMKSYIHKNEQLLWSIQYCQGCLQPYL